MSVWVARMRLDVGDAGVAGVVLSIWSISGWMSLARTVPLGPTRRARRMLW